MQYLEKQIKEINIHKNKKKNNNNGKRCLKHYFSNRKRTGIGTKRCNRTIRGKNTSSSTGTETNQTKNWNQMIMASSTGTENRNKTIMSGSTGTETYDKTRHQN